MISASFYEKLYNHPMYRNSMTREEIVYRIEQRAKALKIKSHVDKQLKEVERKIKEDEKKIRQEEKQQVSQSIDGITNFTPDETGKSYPVFWCGRWIATEDGIESVESSRANQRACYHPIIPIKRMRNLQTGEEQITLAFKRGGLWSELTVPKDMVANSRQITTLSKYGVGVTSEGARLLVKFLADVENANEDKISLIQARQGVSSI